MVIIVLTIKSDSWIIFKGSSANMILPDQFLDNK